MEVCGAITDRAHTPRAPALLSELPTFTKKMLWFGLWIRETKTKAKVNVYSLCTYCLIILPPKRVLKLENLWLIPHK